MEKWLILWVRAYVCVCVCQGADLSVRRLGEEKTALLLRLKQLEDDNQQLHTHTQHTQLELTHTLDILSRYTHTSATILKTRTLSNCENWLKNYIFFAFFLDFILFKMSCNITAAYIFKHVLHARVSLQQQIAATMTKIFDQFLVIMRNLSCFNKGWMDEIKPNQTIF